MANTKTMCHKCKKEVDISQVKYIPKDDDEMMIVCTACSGENPNTQVIQTKSPKLDSIIKKIVPQKPLRLTKIKCFCGRCKYKFKYKPDSTIQPKCPYCGKSDKVIKDKSDIKTILAEVSSPDFDEMNLF